MVEEINPLYYPKIVFVESSNVKIPGLSDQNEIIEESEENVVACPICNLNFINKEEFDQHNVEIHGKRQYLCNLCTACFRRQDHLKRHLYSVHSNSRCSICPVCSKDCKRHDLLLKHIHNYHSDQSEVYHCRDCSFECGSLEELEKHEKSHISHRHKCPQCKTSFNRRDHMLRHIKSQHLQQYTSCPICNQTYKRKDHVVRHVREKHRMGFLNGKLITSSEVSDDQ